MATILEHYHMDLYQEAKRILEEKEQAEEATLYAEQRLITAEEWIRRIPPTDLKALMIITARNAAKSFRKTSDSMFNPLGEEQDEILRSLEKRSFPYLPKLRSNYQDVIVLKYYYGLSNRVVGNLLGISEENVRIRIFRAKQKIQEFLERGERI